MSLHALDDIGDAIDATKSFLFPVEKGNWLRLAVVVFFLGSSSGGLNLFRGLNSASNLDEGAAPTGPDGEFAVTGVLDGVSGSLLQVDPGGELPPGFPQELLAESGLVVLGAFVALVLFGLFAALLSNFMEFVFVQSLVDRETHVRRYLRKHVGNGLRLLAFRLALDVVALLGAGLVFGAFFLLALGGEASNLTANALLASSTLIILAIAVGAVILGTVTGFTNVFVVPMMVQRGDGILAGWRRLLPSLSDHPKQYLGYLAVSIVLAIGVGIMRTIFNFVVLLILGIPLAIVAFCIVTVLGEGPVAIALLAISVVVFAVTLLLAVNLIKVPLQAFLRYYAMLVLGDIDESIDPVPAVRADIRSDDADTADGSTTGTA